MSFLFASKKTGSTVPELTGLQIQTSVNVLPIAIIYGSPRVQMNIIYANGFHKQAIKQSSPGLSGLLSGGKGGGNTQFIYKATFIGALGEGPLGPLVDDIVEIYDNQSVYTLFTLPTGKVMDYFSGTSMQLPWTFVTSNWPNDAFSYKDTAYFGFNDYPLDSSATIPFLNFVIHGIFAGSCPLNLFTASDGRTSLLDADPALCVFDFLTDPTHGVGFPAAFIDQTTLFTSADGFNSMIGDAALSTYCQAVGLGWSIVLNNAEPAASILDRWLKNLVVAPVWTGSILKFIPYWDFQNGLNTGFDGSEGGALKYYTPDTTPLFDFTDNDFQQASQGEDPVIVTRVDVADVKNVVRGEYKDRGNQFNPNVSEVKDETAVELFGPRVDRVGSMDEFTHGNYAGTSVTVMLQRNLSVRNTYTFRLDWRWCILDPMDVVTITDVTLQLSKFPVRIRSIEEDEKGILTILAEEFPVASAHATVFAQQANIPPPFITNAVPAKVNSPLIFEPTAAMLAAQGAAVVPQIVLGACGGPSGAFDPNWGGCIVNVSNDGVTYSTLGTFEGPSRMGVTTASLAAWTSANPDNTNTLSVSLVESAGALDTVTSAQAAAGLTLCAILDPAGDLELLAYTTATLTGANAYDLTGLYRGLYGTIACAHASGSQFLRVDTPIFEAPLPPAFIGVPLSIKLQSFNTYGLSIEDISTCAVYTYTPTGGGTDITVDPIWSALLAGTPVDLNSASTDTLDLNLGGGGACAPVLSTVDLGAG